MNLEQWIEDSWVELVGNECQHDGCNVNKWTLEPMDYLCEAHNG